MLVILSQAALDARRAGMAVPHNAARRRQYITRTRRGWGAEERYVAANE
jgi:hypothetical protein